MAKKKLDLSGPALKKMALDHVEKAVFGLCAVVLLVMVYFGYSKPIPIDTQKNNPKSLISKADRAKSRINSTEWDDPNSELTFAKFRVPNLNVPNKVEKLLAEEVDPSSYPVPAFGQIQVSSKPKRSMPVFVAAQDLRAQFAFQLIALESSVKGGSGLINDAPYAPEKKDEEKRRRPKKKKDDSSGMGGFPGMSGSGSTGGQGSSPGAGGMSSGGGVPSSGGGGAPGSGGNGAGKSKKKEPEGPILQAPPVMLSEIEGVPIDGALPNGKPMWRQVVCVTAVVPYKQQLANYEKALKGTRRYDPMIDQPRYIGLKINRRVNGGDWEDVTGEIESSAKLVQSILYPNLIVAEEYDPFLNSQVPPFMLANFDDFVVHPKATERDFLSVPEEESEESEASESQGSGEFGSFGESGIADGKSDDEDGDGEPEEIVDYPTSETAPEFKQIRFFDLLANRNIKPGDKIEYTVSAILSNPNLPLEFVMGDEFTSTSRKGSGGSGQSGRAGASGGDRSSGLMAGGGSGAGTPGGGMPSSGGGSGGASPGAGGMTSGSGRMSGGASSGRMSGGSGAGPAELTATLELEMLGNPNISDSDLVGDIRPQVLKIKELGPADLEDSDVTRKYGIITPESKPSNAVEFTVPGDRVVMGTVEPVSTRRASNVQFYDTDPTGKIVLLAHNQEFHLKIPGEVQVVPGTPLVFEDNAEVFNPIDWTVRWVGPPKRDEDGNLEPEKRGPYPFRSNMLVLDVMPSEELENQTGTKEEFYSPAEILVFDGDGGFSLRNELDDMRDYRHALFIPEESAEEPEAEGGFGGGFGSGAGGAPGGAGGGFPGF